MVIRGGFRQTAEFSENHRYAFAAEARLNKYLRIQAYLKENTTLHNYKDQLVNAV
jgi:hypothetical protein